MLLSINFGISIKTLHAGIKTGLKLLKNARDSGGRTLKDILNKKLAYIPAKRFSKWEDEDIRMILKAEECFRYQLVFNTKTKNIEPLGGSLKYYQIWLILYRF